jgi:hypothetical protein
MSDFNRIIWLASYPKSGNTWFRAFLANLLYHTDKPADINELQFVSIASNRQLFDEMAGISSSDLTFDEIEKLRPYVYEQLAENLETDIFMKIHDAFIYTSEGKLLVSEKASKKALYFIRNPLDVAVSFAHHSCVSFDKIVKIMNTPDYSFCNSPDRLNNQMFQRLLTWSEHIKSWTEQNIIPVKILKYEDMHNDSYNIFREALEFLELKYSNADIKRAIRFSAFNELQKQEKKSGFKEKAPLSKMFFRKGKVGSWREELVPELTQKIISQHFYIMKKFGYLDQSNNPVY